jgi:hypothetical protein
MKMMKCPKCGRGLDVTGRKPGSSITCECGNISTVAKAGMSRGLLFVLIGISGVVLMCPCVGILSAIAIPNFIKFQARSKQTECKSNLKGWYVAQRAYHAQMDVYEPRIQKVGFSPERGNRYAYFAGPGPLEVRSSPQLERAEALGVGVDTLKYPMMQPISLEDLPADLGNMAGLSGKCPACEITLLCAGQVDNDETLDVWSISTKDRQVPEGESVPAGVPYNHVNDVNT